MAGWTPEILKVGEHEFFFLKAKKNNLKVFYTNIFGIRHYPKKSFKYMKYRLKAESFFKKACELEKINSFEVFDLLKNQSIYKYNEKEKK